MRFTIVPMALGAFAFVLPTEGRSAVTCSASVSDIVFGEVLLRNALAQQTIGDLTISCTGDTGGGEARACLYLGDGSGGGNASARTMLRNDGEELEYQLTSGGQGGIPWNDVQFTVPLNAQGAGQVYAKIYAEILSTGSNIKGGSYNSSFSGDGEVSLRFGQGSCEAGGSSTPDAFQVSASVSPHCTVTVGSMEFGDISGQLASGAEAEASLSITCTENAPYAVILEPGLGPDVSDPQFRKMSNNAQTLAYGLYADPGGSRPWGWTVGLDDVAATGTGQQQEFTVYGRVHGGQAAVTGDYTDSVVVTVQY